MGRKTCLWAGKKKKGLQCKNWQNVNKTIFPKTGFRFNIVIFLNVHVAFEKCTLKSTEVLQFFGGTMTGE
jgi:hypothetical protein